MPEKKELQYNELIERLYRWKYPKKDPNDIKEQMLVLDLTFQVTEACTLACKYCYQHDKSPKRMSLDTAKKLIDMVFTNEGFKEQYHGFVLDFIGGEPFLEPKLISDIIDYWDYKCIMENIEWGIFTMISLCSNGTEWDKPEVQALMRKVDGRLSFTVSIDGNKELHDSARVHLDGITGSYDEAIHAATEYEKMYGEYLGSKMTIAPSNVIFTYSALKHYLDQGRRQIFANCVFEEGWTLDHAKMLYEQAKKLADYKLEYYPETYLSLFEEDNFCPLPDDDNKNWCGGNGGMLGCDPDGILYPCLRFMPSSVGHDRDDYVTVGSVDEGVDWSKIDDMRSITRRSQSTDECYYCPIGKGCAWCTAYNWEVTGSYNKRVTYICPMHKARALVNVYYWNKYYRQIGSEKRMKNYCPEEWALQIISKEEYDMLNELTK